MRASVGESALWVIGLIPMWLALQACGGTSSNGGAASGSGGATSGSGGAGGDGKPSGGSPSGGAESPGGSAGEPIGLGGTTGGGGESSGGSVSGGGKAAAGASSKGGAQGSGGALSNGGTAGSGSVCPPAIPPDGFSCTVATNCIYLDCNGAGRVTASCDGNAFSVSAVACSDIPLRCGINDCAAGQVCLEQYSGTAQRTCSANPCGTHAIECGCAASLCPTGWACSTQGVTVRCSSPCTNCP